MSCHRTFSGEPYDGAWWRYIAGLNPDGCYYLALLWLITGDHAYLEKSQYILTEYTRYYPQYETHGGIPNNNPGRCNAQTLCDSMWIRMLAFGYDIIKETFSEQQQKWIEETLFTPCCEFLIQYRTPQLHNHEVLAGASIGVLGILLNREDFIYQAVDAPYGLKYQLDHCVLEDFFWFEGTFTYHHFALDAFFKFEKFARHTPYSLMNYKDMYRKMIGFTLKVLQPDYALPAINDVGIMKTPPRLFSVYEFAYAYYRDADTLKLLHKGYEGIERDNLDAFLYGVEELPPAEEITLADYHNAEGSGITIIHGDDKRFLLFKHAPYGGEHDHFDRMDFYYLAYGESIIPDLGTVGYGAPHHYGYYKNTAAHNTVVINESNHSPVNSKVLNFTRKNGVTQIDCVTKWDGTYQPLNTHTQVEWDETVYQGVSMRRIITWCGKYFVEVFVVDTGDSPKTVDWVVHVNGKPDLRYTAPTDFPFGQVKPYNLLENVRISEPEKKGIGKWQHQNCRTRLYSFCSEESRIYYADGPNAPATETISYFINRVVSRRVVFANVFETSDREDPSFAAEFSMEQDSLTVNVTEQNGIGIPIYSTFDRRLLYVWIQ